MTQISFLKWCKEEKCEENWAIFRNIYHQMDLVCEVVYMESTKYVNLVQTSPVVMKIQGVGNDDLVVPLNNTLTCHTSLLATDT